MDQLVPDEASSTRIGELRWYERRGKRVLDIVVGATALGLTAPVIAVACLALRTSVGPGVFIRQRRVGRAGQDFDMLKLRTMHHSRRQSESSLWEGPERRQAHKTAHDPRHTTVGRWCRKLSIDELPQLWHVLRGEMSLVGPRPELATVVDRHGLRGHVRHRVRPGLTGQWQVTQRALQVPLHECFDDDVDYLGNITLRNDLAILRRTFGAIARGTGS